MHTDSSLAAVLRPALLGLLLFVSAALPLAAQNTVSQEQMEALRNLTPEARQALMQQLAAGDASAAASSRTTDNLPAGSAAARDRTEDARRRAVRETPLEPRIPVFKPDDTVLVQVDLPKRRFVLDESSEPNAKLTGMPDAMTQGQFDTTLQKLPQAGKWVEPPELTDDERKKLEDLIALIRSRNPYRLDKDGALVLPGFMPMALGGLTETQAGQRLSAEPALLKIEAKIILLPLTKTGMQGLKPFGYDLFDSAPSTFSPLTDIPVPASYVVGTGDELSVQLYGTQNRTVRLIVGRDGRVSFPQLGPISVGGQDFQSVKRDIESRVEQQMAGVRASVTMGEVRSIRVFVLGEARQPGSYTVSGLASITSALFASGGVKPIGSLRDIQLKRQGAVVRRLDLYDLLIRGDTSDDARLLPGDAIFIPPVGATVSVSGEVKRPGIYELRGENRVTDLVAMAGGLSSEADAQRGSLTSVNEDARRVVTQVSLAPGGSGGAQVLRNGDSLLISRLRPTLDSGVVLQGAVFRPGPVAWRAGLRLSDVVGSVDELRPNADQRYLLIRRELPPNRRIAVVSADLGAALAARGSDADVLLQPRDQITVFDLAPGRQRVIKPIMDELRLQSALDQPTEVVRVEGRVKVPGEYPLEPNMRISDLLRAGGNLESAAYGGKAELARYAVVNGESRQTQLIEVDLAAVRRGDAAANLPLQPFDYLLIKETPDWGGQESVTLEGEVRFPGTYPIRRGETLHELLARAGGLTALSFPRGSAFTRKELKEREQKQLDMLSERLQTDLASLALQAAAANQSGASQAMQAGQSLLGQLRGSQAVGRLVIDLPSLMGEDVGSPRDIVLKDGDRLVVPRRRQEVTVIGEVQSVTSHFFRANLTRDDYIALSGGATRKADRRKIYVVRTDGSVVSGERRLFSRNYETAIMPGDTIVVPLNTERIPKLPFWQAVTQIIYNLAVSVAAINSF